MDPKPSPYPVHCRAGSLTMELYASPVDPFLSPNTRRRGSPSYDKFAWQPGGLLTRVIGYTTIHIYVGESRGDGRGARVNIRKCHRSMKARTSAMLRDTRMNFEMNGYDFKMRLNAFEKLFKMNVVLYYVRSSFLSHNYYRLFPCFKFKSRPLQEVAEIFY